MVFKTLAEVEWIVNAHLVGYLGHGIVTLQQQLGCLLHAHDANVLVRRITGYTTYLAVENRTSQPHDGSKLVDSKLGVLQLLLNDGL